jgi:signal transduction histidine kinase
MAEPRRAGLSVRQSVLGAILLVVVSPVAFVLVTHLVETVMGDRTLERTQEVADVVVAELGRNPDRPQLAEKARIAASRHRHRVRLIAPDGTSTLLADELIGTSLLYRIGDFFYGSERANVLGSFDDARGPLSDRPVVKAAREAGHATSCKPAPASLEICDAARRVDLPDGSYVVHAQGSSRKALGALYDSRRQLAKLTLYVALLGAVLGLWMSRRVVAPLERLREDVRSRARAQLPASNLSAPRRDEVGALTDAFNSLLRALAARREGNERLLAELAHELKGPIATLRVHADRLRDGTASLSAEESRELGQRLGVSVDKLNMRVEQFLELARAEAGLVNESRHPVNLEQLLRGLVEVARERNPGVTLELDLQEGVTVDVVPTRMETALANLLDNACFFAGKTGTVRVRLGSGENVELEISDDGPGIPESEMTRVFDAFYSTREGGTGLGLAQARAVIEAHAGSIQVESPKSQGTTLRVTLARADSHTFHSQ